MQSVQCLVCKHYLGDQLCPAFASVGIPAEILQGEFDHRERHPDQENEDLFELDPEAPEGADPTLRETAADTSG